MEITKEIARRIVSCRFDDLPPEVVDYSKKLALSALGAMVAGSSRNSGRMMTAYVQRAGGNPEATVFGAGFKTSVEAAAMANATFAHATEYEDDSFPEAVSSYTLFPALFALGEKGEMSGREVIEAFVVGYETQARVALACPEARRRGMTTLTLAGTLGCAASTAKLLKLGEDQTTTALSLAASQCSGLAHQTGTGAHTFEMGVAARNGVTAGLLARYGFTAKSDVFEAPRGLFNIINGGKAPEYEEFGERWGNPFRVMAVGIKRYPCCYHLQRIIEGILTLRWEHTFGVADVEEIIVEVNPFLPQVVQYQDPANEDEAQFSLPHAVAAALVEERISPHSFSDAALRNELFRETRQKVRMLVRQDWEWGTIGWAPIIRVRLKSGQNLMREQVLAKGQPPDLLSSDEVVEKYETCVDNSVDRESVKKSESMVLRLELAGDVRDIVEMISCNRPEAAGVRPTAPS